MAVLVLVECEAGVVRQPSRSAIARGASWSMAFAGAVAATGAGSSTTACRPSATARRSSTVRIRMVCWPLSIIGSARRSCNRWLTSIAPTVAGTTMP